MIKVTLNNKIRQCDHCQAKNIKRTFEIDINGEVLYIGRICISKTTNIDTSGNPSRAAIKIEEYLKSLSEESLDELLDNLLIASENA
jgi:hypothetical protein